MPAEIVIFKHKQTQQQRQRQRQIELQAKQQQNCHRNLCTTLPSSGVDVDAIAVRNTSNAVAAQVDVDVDAAAAATTAWRRRKSSSSSSAKAASTLRTVIIIMALVFSIMQQRQQQQHQQQQQQWLFYNGLVMAVAGELYNTNNSSNDSNDYYKNKDMSLRQAEDFGGDDVSTTLSLSATASASATVTVAASLPQTEATNHTFKSLAFLANTNTQTNTNANNVLLSSGYSPSPYAPHSPPDGFAVASQETETDSVHSMPIFDFGMPRNITGRTGHTEAIIKCRVDSLHDKSVSWIRKRDLHILTVGTATYTSDKRFQVTESKDAREWTLHVKSPQAKDSGIYECQVNTEPKMSMAFQLNIIEISPDAKAVISGPHDLHFKAGSAIILNCVVKQPSVKDIGPIYWYRGEHMITPFDSDVSDADNQIKESGQGLRKEQSTDQTVEQSLNEVLSTELAKDFTTRIAMESQLGDTLKSRLRISNAQTTDTGNYTCQPTTASSASVMVHVINDENPAAMQKSSAGTLALFGQHIQTRMLMLLLWLLLSALQWDKY
ncbi:uncharacterized protein LOC133840452 [Drosophila sulfurigaster albostrigata]|uniref:uncharacterized protein LOC133840452 n=1 Tax=Drosophila sulfurigaster albostrigata TaxID=89887 RepID=UPI002D21A9F5|nr:uncharacterized protein LOC133840452 [Drosophila sulfurigaster albostrigata]XP_062128287.1 uncharacterized protein LOC133840452 [Drosophila sulfurigaster albostrigata]